ncbi:MAG: SIS domain-containing protein [Spirochaetales bacterium]
MTRFEAEIQEMPRALRALISYYRGEGAARLDAFGALAGPDRELFFSGMGTSLFCPEVMFPRLTRAGRRARSVDAGEWLHKQAALYRPESLLVLTSQSGESAELARLVERGVGAPYVAITNNEASTLANSAQLVLPLRAGDEASISNKTYSNTLALCSLLASALEGPAELRRTLDLLERCADALENQQTTGLDAAAEALRPATGLAFVGRGSALVAARQCALTFMEGTRILCSAFAGGAFNHGPFESVGPGFGLVILDGGPSTRVLAHGLADRARALGATVVVAGSAPAAGDVLSLPVSDLGGEEYFPLLFSKAQNLLIHRLAALKGHEAGIFRHGGKVTRHE